MIGWRKVCDSVSTNRQQHTHTHTLSLTLSLSLSLSPSLSPSLPLSLSLASPPLKLSILSFEILSLTLA